ncbi:MAG: phasin family protein [bacterium]|nr:phasin family protein [bacterium]
MSNVGDKLRERLPDLDSVREKLKTRKDGLEEKTRELIMGIMDRLNLPTRDEVTELRERLDRLSKEVKTISRMVKKDKEDEGQS